ncbi:MAG: hypothetical protein RIQ79_815 [Verrucomicrobiota bacterium]
MNVSLTSPSQFGLKWADCFSKLGNRISNIGLKSLAAAVGLMIISTPAAKAQWTYASGNLNAAQTYDGVGVDSALNPRSQGATSHNDYIGVGGTGSITVASGSLTILANDFKFGRNTAGSVGNLTVASGASFNINQTNQWGGGIGAGPNNTTSVVGVANIAGTMNWYLSGSSEQTFIIGNGGSGTFGTLNMNGGTMVIELDSTQATNATPGLRVGSGGAGTGAINLNSGLLQVKGNLPFALGGQWNTFTTTPAFAENGNGTITVNNGSLELLGSSFFAVGTTGDYVNFIVGGTGHLSIVGWDNVTDPSYTKFKALIDAGKIRLNGATVTVGDYSGFIFSTTGSQGVLAAVSNLAVPSFITQPIAITKFVGQSASFTSTVAGNPTPTVQWEKSTNGGTSWSPVSGATSTSLSFASLVYANNGLYRLVATNSQGSATSTQVLMTVTYPVPTIVTAPASQTVLIGGNTTLSVSATGIGSLTYQWQKAGVDIVGQTGTSLVLTNLQPADAAIYTVVVTDHAAEADALVATTIPVSAYVGVLNASTPSHAISLNFVGAAPGGNSFSAASDLGVLAGADSAGVLPVANWNNSAAVNAVPVQTTPLALVDNMAVTSTVSATWSSANTWAASASGGAAASKTADGRLYHGYIERRATVSPGNSSVSFTQIPYGTYDVYIYVIGGALDVVGQASINGNTANSYFYKAYGAAVGFPGYVQATATTLADAQAQGYRATFVRFAGVTGSSLTVAVADAVSGQNAGGIAAISIVDTTPAGSAYPPLISSVPVSALKLGGESATFSVVATSVNPSGVISYQWLKNGSPISGQTAASLPLSNLTSADTASYSVIVTDTSTAVGSPTSLTVGASLVVVDGSRSALLNVDFGTSATSLTGVMVGDGILRSTGVPASGANTGLGVNTGGPGTALWNGLTGAAGTTTYGSLKESTGLSLAGVTFAVNGAGGVEDNITVGTLGSVTDGAGPLMRDYLFVDTPATGMTCTVGGLAGFVGKKVTLVVYAVGKLSTLFGEAATNDGATVTLSGDNNYLGTAPFITHNIEGRDLNFNLEAYAVYEGIVSATGTVSWTLGADTDLGRIPLNGFQLLITSANADIAPAINTQPVSVTRLAGLPVTFTAGVTASPAATLQWQKSTNGIDWTNVSGANSTSYDIASVSSIDTASYRVVATNTAGSATSSAAVLTVQTYPMSSSRGINVNWQRIAQASSVLAPTDQAGVVSLSHWNNRTASATAFPNLLDSSGETTAASVALGAGGDWFAFSPIATHPMQKLFQAYWDATPGASAVGASATMTISGLTYTNYDVYLYLATDGVDNSRTAQVSINGGAPVYGKVMGSAQASAIPLYMAQATATTAETATLSNYVKVTALTGSSFTVTLTKVDTNYGIAGIQIVNTGTTAPTTVVGLTGTPNNAQATLVWTATAGATSYNVYRAAMSGGAYTRIATNVSTTNYTDTGLTNSTPYYYVVKAVNAGGASDAYSSEVSVTPGNTLTAIQTWRQTNFGTSVNSGNGADVADPDGDGVSNLLEYASGTNPNLANTGSVIVTAVATDKLTLSFVHIDDPTLSYVVEASNDLTGAWTTAQTYTGFTTAATTTYTDTALLSVTPRRFLRLKIVLP